MAKKIIMPKQGLQMTEGTILSWLVKEGEKVEKGQPLFEMETDKLTITMDSTESGTLLKIVRGEGETVPITETIAIVGEPGEDISDLLGEASGKPAADVPAEKTAAVSAAPAAQTDESVPEGGRIFITPRAKMRAEEMGIDYTMIRGTGEDGLIVERDILAAKPAITPLAKKIAELSGVDVSGITGTGAHGKIVRDDIVAAARIAPAAERGTTLMPFKGMRKVIAERMVESLHTAAQATHRISVDMTEAVKVREAFMKMDKKLSYNDIVSYAVVRALKDYPIVNSELTDEGIVVKHFVDLGIAVAVENGLIVPVVRDADLMSLEELSAAAKALAEKAKNGTLGPDEYKGGTFTISNLGMFGLDSFVAIINRPESGIIAVGRIAKKPVVDENDEIVVRPMMELTLTYDHRVVDGAPAAQFLARVKTYLEQPYLLL